MDGGSEIVPSAVPSADRPSAAPEPTTEPTTESTAEPTAESTESTESDTGGPGARRSRLASGLRVVHAFSSAANEKRARRPTDVLLLVLCLLALGLLSLFAPGPTDADESFTAVLDSLPGVLGEVWRVAFALLSLWSAFLILLVAIRPGRRRLLGDFGLAAGLSLVMAFLLSTWAGTTMESAWGALLTPDGPPVYLALRIALATAVIVTAAPHLAHWLRFVGRGILLVGAIAGVGLGVALPIGTTAGFLVGVVAAAATHLILGSPGGRPTSDAVARGLDELGLVRTRVTDSAMSITGSAMFSAEGGPDGALSVKTYGRDAWDGQFLTSTWNSLFLRGERPDLSAGRLPRAEHEALVCVLAERAGVPVLPVVAVGVTEEGDVLVVTHAPVALALRPEAVDAELAAAWRCLQTLHAANLAHGAVGGSSLVIDRSGRVALSDFAQATIAAQERELRMDDARLLVASALAVGPDRAVTAALAANGAEGLSAILPFVQPAVLDGAMRKQLRDQPWGVKSLVRLASERLDATPPDRERISRTSVGAVAKLAFLALFGYWIVGFVSDVDWSQVAAAFRTADVADLAVGLALSPVVQVWLAVATLGATLVALRFAPVLMLQYGIQFIGLVVPSSAARVALEVRFFTGWGMRPGPAMTVGMVDSFMGFLVQMVLIAVIFLSGLVVLSPAADSSQSSTSSTSSSSGHSLLSILIVLGIVALLALLLYPSTRRQVRSALPRAWHSVRDQVSEAKGALAVLRSPGKVSLMIGGNLMAQLTQAVILALCLAAFGESESLLSLVLVNTFVSLFAGFMPVPGGMGVAEAGYSFGLQALGVPADVAVSTALMFRAVTFYLPPLWGSLAMRWLRRREYV